jgi:hypothetical protein
MSTGRLRPPSVQESGEALAPIAPVALDWPTSFDDPAQVELVWAQVLASAPPGLAPTLERALDVARSGHADQQRRGGLAPYWVHLVRVAAELQRWREDTPDLLVAAVLHDLVEDTDVTLDDLARGFGPGVAEIVRWLTAPPGEEATALRAYYARLLHAPFEARLLKLADRVDNLRSIQALVMRTGERYRRWAGGYLRRTRWQVVPLAPEAPSVARVSLVVAMADLAPLVGVDAFTDP